MRVDNERSPTPPETGATELNHIFYYYTPKDFPSAVAYRFSASFAVIKRLIIQWGTRNSICAVAGGGGRFALRVFRARKFST